MKKLIKDLLESIRHAHNLFDEGLKDDRNCNITNLYKASRMTLSGLVGMMMCSLVGSSACAATFAGPWCLLWLSEKMLTACFFKAARRSE